MSYDPNVSHATDLDSKIAILNAASSVEGRVDNVISLKCQGGELLKKYFVGSVSLDDKFSEIGFLKTYVSALAADATVGDLWVDYTIQLYRPKVAGSLGALTRAAHFYVDGTASNTNRFGPSVLVNVNDTLVYGVDYKLTSTNIINLITNGRYWVQVYWSNSGAAITTNPSMGVSGSATAVNFSGYNGTTFTNSVYGSIMSLNTFATWAACVDITGTGGFLTFAGLAGLTTADLDVYITQIPTGIRGARIPPMFDALIRKLNIKADELMPPERNRVVVPGSSEPQQRGRVKSAADRPYDIGDSD